MNDDIVPIVENANKLFLKGPFGTGKTTLAVRRLRWLVEQERIRGADIIVITPQRTLARPYTSAVRSPDMPPGPPIQVTTVASLARRSVELYWPLISPHAGFADLGREPVFLNLETSQYHMGALVDAAFESGAFQGIRVERNRVISQILDNLNKAALNGFTIDEAYTRLDAAAPQGEQRAAALNALQSAKAISHRFRALCLDQNLVDYSLQIDLFNTQVLRQNWSRTHLLRSFRHLVFDNIEEDTVTAHRLVETWLPNLDSALLIADRDGGMRVFLGAAPGGVSRLQALCARTVHLEDSHTMSLPMQVIERTSRRLLLKPKLSVGTENTSGSPAPPPDHQTISVKEEPVALAASSLVTPDSNFRFYPQMISWVANRVQELVDDKGVDAGEIVVLAPYMSDALRFSLQTELSDRSVASTTHRPSRPLRNEPAARSLLTLASLAHPYWQELPSMADVAALLATCINGADPVRADLLASRVYHPRTGSSDLSSFEILNSSNQQRVTYRLGERYDRLRTWLEAYRAQTAAESIDHFWSRIFGEVLSQPGYAFHEDMDAARVVWQLVNAARNFRWAVEPTLRSAESGNVIDEIGQEFCQLVEAGAVGALFPGGWEEREEAVLIAPAYTFLMRNRAVDYQFWLDVGSTGWWERLYQPLTHPYVLSRAWPANRAWTDLDEYQSRQSTMRRLVLGLLRRARKGIYLGLSQYSESGFEQRGPLLAFANSLTARLNQGSPALASGKSS